MDQLKARVYFLEQGQSISKLKGMLDNGVVLGMLKRGLSVLIEAILYVFFLLLLFITIYIPTNPIDWNLKVDDSTQIHAELQNEEIMQIMLAFKFLLFLCSLIPLILAVVLGRNRRKGAIINEAYEEVEKMKLKFDTALKDLAL